MQKRTTPTREPSTLPQLGSRPSLASRSLVFGSDRIERRSRTRRTDPDPVVAVRRNGSPILVLSKGLIETLPERELEAVLAHEVAHLSNDDLQLTSWLLVPLFAAEFLHDDGERPWDGDPIGWLLATVALVGVGVFSRGREIAADRAAVAATGDPGSLASALERLDDHRSSRPTTDLRKHAQSTNAVSVLPTLGTADSPSGLRSTHPPLETRLEALRSLSRERRTP